MPRRNRSLWMLLAALVASLLVIGAADAAPDTPTFVDTFGSPGTAQLDDPIAIDIDAAGNWYVADYTNDRIEVFTPSGAFLRTIGGPGIGTGQMDQPNGVPPREPPGHVRLPRPPRPPRLT